MIAKPLYVIMENNKRQAGPRMGKTDSFLKSIGRTAEGWSLKWTLITVLRLNTSFDSFHKLTVVYNWQLDS